MRRRKVRKLSVYAPGGGWRARTLTNSVAEFLADSGAVDDGGVDGLDGSGCSEELLRLFVGFYLQAENDEGHSDNGSGDGGRDGRDGRLIRALIHSFLQFSVRLVASLDVSRHVGFQQNLLVLILNILLMQFLLKSGT